MSQGKQKTRYHKSSLHVKLTLLIFYIVLTKAMLTILLVAVRNNYGLYKILSIFFLRIKIGNLDLFRPQLCLPQRRPGSQAKTLYPAKCFFFNVSSCSSPFGRSLLLYSKRMNSLCNFFSKIFVSNYKKHVS